MTLSDEFKRNEDLDLDQVVGEMRARGIAHVRLPSGLELTLGPAPIQHPPAAPRRQRTEEELELGELPPEPK